MEWMTPICWHIAKDEPMPSKFHGLVVLPVVLPGGVDLQVFQAECDFEAGEYEAETVTVSYWNENRKQFEKAGRRRLEVVAWSNMPYPKASYLTDRELNTVLACVRHCQEENIDLSPMDHFEDIPEGPVPWDEVDALIEDKLYGLM